MPPHTDKYDIAPKLLPPTVQCLHLLFAILW